MQFRLPVQVLTAGLNRVTANLQVYQIIKATHELHVVEYVMAAHKMGSRP